LFKKFLSTILGHPLNNFDPQHNNDMEFLNNIICSTMIRGYRMIAADIIKRILIATNSPNLLCKILRLTQDDCDDLKTKFLYYTQEDLEREFIRNLFNN